MGALIFAGFMLFLLGAAVVFFLIGSVLLIVGIVKKRRGKKFKALRIVAITVVYCIASICVAIPIGWVSIVRSGNLAVRNYQDTGVYLSSTASEVRAEKRFYYDGDLYVEVEETGFYGSQTELGEALANAIDDKATFWDKFFNYTEDITIYPVKNDSGYKILSFGYNTNYCKEADRDKILEYYRSLPEYEYKYSVFNTESRGFDYTALDFNKEIFDKLYATRGNDEATVRITDDQVIEDHYVYQESPDGLFSRSVSVLFTEDSAYVNSIVRSSNGETEYTCYPLDTETADFVRRAFGF